MSQYNNYAFFFREIACVREFELFMLLGICFKRLTRFKFCLNQGKILSLAFQWCIYLTEWSLNSSEVYFLCSSLFVYNYSFIWTLFSLPKYSGFSGCVVISLVFGCLSESHHYVSKFNLKSCVSKHVFLSAWKSRFTKLNLWFSSKVQNQIHIRLQTGLFPSLEFPPFNIFQNIWFENLYHNNSDGRGGELISNY